MVVVAIAVTLAADAHAQSGPRYIIVHGGGLPGQILLDDEAGNALLVSAPNVMPRSFVPREADRPVYELAIFFSAPDLQGRDPSTLRPDETAATGRFFPAVGNLEAIFELGAASNIGPRRDAGLTPAMLDYLVSRGVPVVSNVVLPPEQPTPTTTLAAAATGPEEGAGDSAPWLLLLLGGGGLAALAGVVFVSRARRSGRSRPRGVHF